MKFLTKPSFLYLFIALLISGCFTRSKVIDLAPKNIAGLVFSITTDIVNAEDTSLKNKVSYYHFSQNDTYKLLLDGKLYSSGFFSYKKKGENSAEIICAYVYKGEVEETYTMQLTFLNLSSGKWTATYEGNLESPESGEFTIVDKE